MQKINSAISLRQAIVELETKHNHEGKMLKEQFYLFYKSIKPSSILSEVLSSPEIKNNMLNTTADLAANYLSKKLFDSKSQNPIKKLIGTAIIYGVSNLATKNTAGLISLGNGIISAFRNSFAESANRNNSEVE